MTALPQPPKGYDAEWAAQNNRLLEGKIRALGTLEQRFATFALQNAYDNSTDPEILTDSTRGALSLRRGSAADTDNVLEIQNNAGSNTFTVTGAGTATAVTLSVTGNTTLGDASGDTLTINGTAVSIPNNLNFDSNTLFIDATNNRVGIGTASPSVALSVSGAFSCSGNATVGNGTGAPTVIINGDASSNVGIQWQAASVYNGQFVHASGNAFYDGPGFLNIRTLDGSASRFFVSSTGDVGLGTTSPGAKLDVVGTFSCTGNATLGDAATDTVDVKGRIFGSNLHNNASGLSGASYIGSGTYTPTGAAQVNVSSVTVSTAKYMRVGNVVTVSGTVDVSATAAASFTRFSMTLPISSNLTGITDLAGAGTFLNVSTYGPVYIYGDTANDRAFFDFTSVGSGTHNIAYTYTYEVK